MLSQSLLDCRVGDGELARDVAHLSLGQHAPAFTLDLDSSSKDLSQSCFIE